MLHTRWPLLIVSLLICTGCALAQKPSALAENYRAQIQALLPGMAAPAIPDRQGPQQTLEKLCHQAAAPGKEADRAALSNAMMAFVGPETAKPARVWLLRKMETLGGEEAVAELAKHMHDADPEIADLARRALANNPSAKALAALRAELAVAKTPEWKVALINALAWRHDEQSVDAFVKLAGSGDPTGAAALSALAEVASDSAVKALADLRKSAPEAMQPAVVDASLRAAERLGQNGKLTAAAGIYGELVEGRMPEHIRIAGLTGLAHLLGGDAVPVLLKHVTGDDAHLRLIAARCLAQVPQDKKVTGQITDALKQAGPQAKALLIEALGDRGDGDALTFVMAHMMDADADVRLAVYAAMGKLGTAPTVNVLIAQAATSEGEQLEVIRQSIATLKGPGVDDEIIRKLKTATGPIRAESIMAVWGRRITAAKPLLLDMANDNDPKVRVAVLTALERIADNADLPILAQQLGSDKGEACIKAAEKAIASVCRRAGNAEKCAAPLVAALPDAAPAGQAAIVRALGKIQGDAALAAIRSVAASDQQVVREAVKSALAEWKPVYITTWLAAGPFKQEGKGSLELFDIAFPPEAEGGAVDWKPLKGSGSGEFDLSQIAKGDNCCAYVKVTIHAKRKQDVVLSLGSDDGAKVWLNGKIVHEKNVNRALQCSEDEIKATLEEGANTLLLKITQGGGGFEFCCALKAAAGGPVEGVRYEAK